MCVFLPGDDEQCPECSDTARQGTSCDAALLAALLLSPKAPRISGQIMKTYEIHMKSKQNTAWLSGI
jgi:hypothetical protein